MESELSIPVDRLMIWRLTDLASQQPVLTAMPQSTCKKRRNEKKRLEQVIALQSGGWGLGGGVSHMKCIQLLCDLKENELTNKLFDCK